MKECELCEHCKRATWDSIKDHGYSQSWIEEGKHNVKGQMNLFEEE